MLLSAAAVSILIVGAASVRAASHDISIVDYEFQPQSITVRAGEPVTWTNSSGRIHTVTSDGGPELDSGDIGPGEAYGHVFDQPGSYSYHCAIHPDRMKGIVVVEAAATLPPGVTPEPTPPAGTLPPNFSPFPSLGPPPVETQVGPELPTPSTEPSPDAGASGPMSPALLGLILVALLAIGAGTVFLSRRMRAEQDRIDRG